MRPPAPPDPAPPLPSPPLAGEEPVKSVAEKRSGRPPLPYPLTPSLKGGGIKEEASPGGQGLAVGFGRRGRPGRRSYPLTPSLKGGGIKEEASPGGRGLAVGFGRRGRPGCRPYPLTPSLKGGGIKAVATADRSRHTDSGPAAPHSPLAPWPCPWPPPLRPHLQRRLRRMAKQTDRLIRGQEPLAIRARRPALGLLPVPQAQAGAQRRQKPPPHLLLPDLRR